MISDEREAIDNCEKVEFVDAVDTDRSNGGHAPRAGVGDADGDGEAEAVPGASDESRTCNAGISAMLTVARV